MAAFLSPGKASDSDRAALLNSTCRQQLIVAFITTIQNTFITT